MFVLLCLQWSDASFSQTASHHCSAYGCLLFRSISPQSKDSARLWMGRCKQQEKILVTNVFVDSWNSSRHNCFGCRLILELSYFSFLKIGARELSILDPWVSTFPFSFCPTPSSKSPLRASPIPSHSFSALSGCLCLPQCSGGIRISITGPWGETTSHYDSFGQGNGPTGTDVGGQRQTMMDSSPLTVAFISPTPFVSKRDVLC